MKSRKTILTAFISVVILAVIGGSIISNITPVYAADAISGAKTAMAGSGGVTAKTFVKLSAAWTIVAATAVTDEIVGVCEITAAANAMTRYAPIGTQTKVTSGEAIAVGDRLTTGTGSKAFVLDTDDASTQQVGGIAMTAASGADEDVTVILVAGVVEQRLALASLAVGGGYGDTGVTISAAGVIQADGAITGDSLTDGTATIASGALTGTLDMSAATLTYRSIVNADISASADIVRSKLVEEALTVYSIPFTSLRNASAVALVAAAEDDEFGLTSAGFGTGTLVIDGDPASAESETSTLMFEFVLPPEYVAAGDVKLVVHAQETVGAATVATTILAEAYESDGEGAVGSDLYNAFDNTDIVYGSWTTCTSVITATDLTAGDRLIVFVRIVTNDTGGSVGTVAQIGEVDLQIDIKG